MKSRRSIPKAYVVIFFALLGNFIGSLIYQWRTGQRASWLIFDYSDAQQRRTISLPVWPNFGPALFLGLLVRPSWLVSLVVGAVMTALLGDEVQVRLVDGLGKELEKLSERKRQAAEPADLEDVLIDS